MNFLRHLLNILNPPPSVGGLQVTDSALRFVLIKGSAPVLVSFKLPDGVISEGRVKNKDEFKNVLAKLHAQITPKNKKKIYAVLNISENNVYSQVFNLPLVAVEDLEGAIKLNLRTLCPIDFNAAYSDWQKVGENSKDGGQLEILGSFTGAKIVDEIIECLKQANFIPAAVEFSSLAISRLVSEIPNFTQPFFLLHLTASGLNFTLIKNSNLYFSRFVAWPVSVSRQISLAAVKDILIRETKNLLNFSASRWPETQINTLILATPSLEEKLSEIIAQNFSLAVKKMVLPSNPSLASDWFIAYGSALRGLIPRSKDILISLARTGTEEEFRQERMMGFLRLWRNVALTALFFILIVFAGADVFLTKTANSLNSEISNIADLSGNAEFQSLQKQANDFNKKVSLSLEAKSQATQWPPFFEKIKNLAGYDIEIQRIYIQSKDAEILFNGKAGNDKAILDFKDKLEKDLQFEQVKFPVSGVSQSADGKLSFSMTFKLKS